MRAEQTSFLFGANAPFIEELHARYLENPDSVDREWQTFFAALADEKDAVLAEVRGASWAPNGTRVIDAGEVDVPAAANRNVKENGQTGGKAANGRGKADRERPTIRSTSPVKLVTHCDLTAMTVSPP